MQCPQCGKDLFLERDFHAVETYELLDDGNPGQCIRSNEVATYGESLVCDNEHHYSAVYDDDELRWKIDPDDEDDGEGEAA